MKKLLLILLLLALPVTSFAAYNASNTTTTTISNNTTNWWVDVLNVPGGNITNLTWTKLDNIPSLADNYTEVRFNASFANRTTDNLTEGTKKFELTTVANTPSTNMSITAGGQINSTANSSDTGYYTDTKARAAINGSDINLGNFNLTATVVNGTSINQGGQPVVNNTTALLGNITGTVTNTIISAANTTNNQNLNLTSNVTFNNITAVNINPTGRIIGNFTKVLNIDTPAAAYKYEIGYFENGGTINNITGISIGGTSASIAFETYNNDMSTFNHTVNTSVVFTTAKVTITSFTNATISAGQYLFANVTAVSGAVNSTPLNINVTVL